MNFKRIVEDVIETETLEQKEKRYLGWVVRSILNQKDAQSKVSISITSHNMFIRIFGFNPDTYKGKYLYNFVHYLTRPYYHWLSEEQIKEIEKIANIEYLTRVMTGNNQIDLYNLFQDIAGKYDLPEDKITRILNIIFTVVGIKIAKAGHKDWEKLLLRKNLDKETDQAWGDILDNL